jgi:hypothetical protein
MRIDPLTFAAKWSKPYELSVLGSIFHTTTRVIYLTRVEVGPQPMTTVIALHRETGAELWRKSLNASGSFVAADDHRVYFAASAPSAYGTTLVSYGISKITP